MARGHHYRPAEAHMGDKAMAMRADGGKIPEEKGKVDSYTARPNNVEDEAEGEERKRGGRAKKRADGGGVGRSPAEHEKTDGDERARGGEAKKKHVDMEGSKTKHRRLDRPGRKRGGGVGADMTPLSTAARTHQAEAHKADADELAED